MDTLITVLHVIVCIFLVLVVLLQAGKGGGMGIAFGGAGGSTVFGGSGAGNFLTKLTVISAFLFMITSMTLAYFASARSDDPLKALSAKSRAAAKEREEARKKILDPETAPDGAEGAEGAVDTPEEGLIDTPAEGGVDTPAEGGVDTPAETPAAAEPKPAAEEPKPAAEEPAPADPPSE